MKRFIIKALQTVAAIGIYAGVVWYGISIFDEPDGLDKAFVGLTSLGVTYGISLAMFRTVGEIGGAIMVLAEFLNRHLLEPQKQRLLEEGRKEGQAQERDSIRAKLREQGYDLDKMLPPEENGDVE